MQRDFHTTNFFASLRRHTHLKKFFPKTCPGAKWATPPSTYCSARLEKRFGTLGEASSQLLWTKTSGFLKTQKFLSHFSRTKHEVTDKLGCLANWNLACELNRPVQTRKTAGDTPWMISGHIGIPIKEHLAPFSSPKNSVLSRQHQNTCPMDFKLGTLLPYNTWN